MPVLVDASREPPFALTQSNAILLHIADRVQGRLLPERPERRRKAIERFFYFVTDVIAPSHAAFFLRSRGQIELAADALDGRALDALKRAEQFLEQAQFMAGDTFTLADIAAVTIALSMADKLDAAGSPNLCRWLELTRDRPSVRAGMKAFDPR